MKPSYGQQGAAEQVEPSRALLQYPWLTRVVLQLVRAAAKHRHVAERQLFPLVRKYPEAMMMAGKAALTEFNEMSPQPPEDVRTAIDQATHEADTGDLAAYQAAIESFHQSAEHEDPAGP